MSRQFGCDPDPRDDRDQPYLCAGAPLPTSKSLRDGRVLVRDQDGTNSCVGFAWAYGLQLAYVMDGIECPDLSASAIYYAARATHSVKATDSGTHHRAAAKAVKRFGASSEAAWPFKQTTINKPPNMRAIHDGYDRRGLRAYYRIAPQDLNGIRDAIAHGHPVVFGIDVDRAFKAAKGPTTITSLGAPVGSHAMVCDAYEPGLFGWTNSWGRRWRDGGRVWVNESVMAQAKDVWALDVTRE